MPEEIWLPIPEYRLLGVPAGYEASTECRVRSVPRTLKNGQQSGGVVLEPQPDADNYPRVRLGRKLIKVSVAVALAFHGKPEVRHLNGIRTDNRPENLAWGSHRDNEEDKKRYGNGMGQFSERQFRPETSPRTGLIRLSDAVSYGVVSCSLDALRKASQRDPIFPAVKEYAGLARLYDAEELFTWNRTRYRR